MALVGCPRCKNLVQTSEGAAMTCGKCGYPGAPRWENHAENPRDQPGSPLMIGALLLSVVAVFLFPLVFGAAAFVMAAIAASHRERNAVMMMVVAVVATLVGLLSGIALLT